VALCVATTIILKMGKKRYALVTLAPLVWLVAVTFTASLQKIFSANARIGFLTHARQLSEAAGGNPTSEILRLIFNDRLDAVVTAFLMTLAAGLLIDSGVQWLRVLSGRNKGLHEAPFVSTQLASRSS
jgi:carbon starvation protein